VQSPGTNLSAEVVQKVHQGWQKKSRTGRGAAFVLSLATPPPRKGHTAMLAGCGLLETAIGHAKLMVDDPPQTSLLFGWPRFTSPRPDATQTQKAASIQKA